MSSIKELELELAEIENEIGNISADMLTEDDDERLDWYNKELISLRFERDLIIEEIHYLEIEGED